MVREIDTKLRWGRANRNCDFESSPHVVALIGAEHQRNRALRDRDAHSEGGTNKFSNFDASPYASNQVYHMVREIDTRPWWGRTSSVCDFDASYRV
jgi:hypothetical protein